MHTLEKAWAEISARVPRPCPVERSGEQALGHILAEPVLADRDLPPADRSAMDGFAVRHGDLARVPATLPVIGEIPAGSPLALSIAPGTCARIYTGANLPPDADTVVRIEDTRPAEPGRVTFTRTERAGANVLRRGENAGRGSVLLAAGRVLAPLHIGVCASVGRTQVGVFRKPRVALLVTGRELLDATAPAGAHQERDANGPMLATSLAAAGFAIVQSARLSDELDSITRALREALAEADAVITSGGVSVGDYDFVPAAVHAVGAQVAVHGVAIKPGKPFLFAVAGDGKPIFGLPGNPLSAATGLHELVLPALRRMAGWPVELCRPLLTARLGAPLTSKPGRQRLLLATVAWTATGPEVTAVPSHSSADLVAGAQADGTIVLPPDCRELASGALVEFRPWRRWP